MHEGRTVFAQLMDWLPKYEFNKCVRRHRGDYHVRSLTCYEQFLSMAFAQLTYRESLRDIETCLRALGPKLYHAGIRGRVSRSTLADANEKRPWPIYADFAQVLIAQASALYADEDFGVELQQAAYALDSTTIDSQQQYPDGLRRIGYRDPVTGKKLIFLTNNFTLAALLIAHLYRARWQIELFFKWIKQHLRIKAFYGTSENAVKTQIWIAIAVYVLVAIIKKQLHLSQSPYTILQISSLTLFETMPILQVFALSSPTAESIDLPNQLCLQGF